MTWLLDSYAIIEMVRGNRNYLLYRNEPAVTTFLNVVEGCYVLTDLGRSDLAQACLARLSTAIVPFPLELVPEAVRFRRTVRGATGRRFSYADALGYVLAVSTGLGFLTGADEFRGFPGVELVR